MNKEALFIVTLQTDKIIRHNKLFVEDYKGPLQFNEWVDYKINVLKSKGHENVVIINSSCVQ